MGNSDARRRALEFLKHKGWVIEDDNKNGYTPVKCTCGGKHMAWIHKTPSNPNYFKQQVAHLVGLCEREQREVP